MIFVDANFLLYAEDSTNPRHEKARKWWDAQLSGSSPVCLCWTVLSAFIRIGTNSRVFKNPLTIQQATTRVDSWLNQPSVRVIVPTERHCEIFRKLLLQSQAVGGLVEDAHLAALAIEYNCKLMSADSDFARFKGLKWANPLL